MKIVGAKIFGQDSAIAILDFEKKFIFAVSADRVSRIKKDNFNLDQALANEKIPSIADADIIAYPFNLFGGKDSLLETKGTSYFWLKLEAFRRIFTKPKYRSDLTKHKKGKTSKSLIWHYLKSPHFIILSLLRNIFWTAYLLDALPKSFHVFWMKKILSDFKNRYCEKKALIDCHDHQTCHAYSAFYLSPFINENKVLVFTLDEQGDEAFSKAFMVKNREFNLIGESKVTKKKIKGAFHAASIGSLYSNFTEALGFVRSSDEGKVEALAAFGKIEQDLLDDLESTVFVNNNSLFIKEKNYWKYADKFYLQELREKFGDKNIACTIQTFLENLVSTYLRQLQEQFEVSHLCIAGGVTANVIMNLKINERCNFQHIFICPPMGDEGSALGAAIKSSIENGLDCDWLSDNQMPYYGPEFSKIETLKTLQRRSSEINFNFIGHDWPKIAGDFVAKRNIIAVFNGRMEFGPRSLGNRSIIANPMDPNARDRINDEIKRRHKFQPFCPSVLETERNKLFNSSFSHKHMATAFRIKERFRKKLISAIHIDGTARPQFVEKKDNPEFFELISSLKRKTGIGVVINTSFNLHGRPVVFNIDHAIDDFLDCGLDYLFINGYQVSRKNVDQYRSQ